MLRFKYRWRTRRAFGNAAHHSLFKAKNLAIMTELGAMQDPTIEATELGGCNSNRRRERRNGLEADGGDIGPLKEGAGQLEGQPRGLDEDMEAEEAGEHDEEECH